MTRCEAIEHVKDLNVPRYFLSEVKDIINSIIEDDITIENLMAIGTNIIVMEWLSDDDKWRNKTKFYEYNGRLMEFTTKSRKTYK